ncbi:MAG: SdpI family protein [Proteobacteria bacterium]|nr:SdpI family protein [Pseudomonadota bacterium]
MDSLNITLGLSNIIVAVLIILISIPLVGGKIRMNKVYGIRFKKSYESENNWYRINRYGGKQMILWSVPLAILGVATFFLPLGGKDHWITLIACAPLIVIIPAITSYIYAKNL